jgi:hypothetical protein
MRTTTDIEMVPRGGIEPPTRGFSVFLVQLILFAFMAVCRSCVALTPKVLFQQHQALSHRPRVGTGVHIGHRSS